MAYTTKQEQEIVIARKRIAEKKGTPTDIANVKHFDSKRSLTGTLSGTRSLPDDDSQLTNMQSVMRMFKTESDKAQPSPLSKLQNFESITGIKPITTGAITGVIEMGEKERYADIAERSRTLVDLIGEQEERKEKQRQDNLKWAETLFSSVENPFTVFSSDDIENMKLGIITPEMKGRAGKARTVELLPKAKIKKEEKIKLQPSFGFFDSKIESSFREDLVKLKEQQRADATITDSNIFQTLRLLYSPQEVSDQALNNILGVKPVGFEDTKTFGLPGEIFFGLSDTANSTPAFILRK